MQIHTLLERLKAKRFNWLVLLLTVSSFIVLVKFANSYYAAQAEKAGYVSMEEAEESSEALILKRRKARILENSYNTSIDLGKEYLNKAEPEIASSKFFDAKSIYPTAIEPRMALSKIYFDWAIENNAYCWQAQKEILFALQYVRLSQYPKEFRSLQTMKARLELQCGLNENYAFMDQLAEK
ncbi:MAG: hypothetical protein HKN09_02010 [Saprospiraceae bacterium]|nr:hypothetical protein [Saprospiraceae bacterium]